MRRATTPTHIFTFPESVEVGSVTEVLVSYSQCGKEVLRKTIDDLMIDTENNSFSVKLTQDESTKFAPGEALVQLKARKNNAVFASQMIRFPIKPVLTSEDI